MDTNMDTSKFKFKLGDIVEVVSLREDMNESRYFDIGFTGKITDFQIDDTVDGNQLAYYVERTDWTDGWWVSEDSLELIHRPVPELPERKRGFEKISDDQWATDGISTSPEFLIMPKRKTKRSAGYDIHSLTNFTLRPRESIKLPTGLKAFMEDNNVLFIAPRSSLGFKYRLQLDNTIGVIDADYFDNESNEGHIWIKVTNDGDKDLTIKTGDAFAQAIFVKYDICDDDSFDEGETRVGGIGSTNTH